MDEQDYFRFIHNLFDFNDENPATNSGYYFDPDSMDVETGSNQPLKKETPHRKLLVEILVFTLMPNHFHLLVRQKKDGGIVKFMHKLGTGYTMYFNRRYIRDGVLFQGKFKAVMVERDEYFQYLPHYIHCNPLGLKRLYRGRTSIDWRRKMKFLEDYRWSSFPDYIGNNNFPSVTQRELLINEFGSEAGYKKHTKDYLRESVQLDTVEEVREMLID